MDAIKSNDVVENILSNGNVALGEYFKADVIALSSPMMFGLDDIIKNEVENIHDFDDKKEKIKDKLVVILETTGGYVEVVERIVSVFRRHYKEVEFVIPNYAYSAGTLLALSGDDIHMSYYSVLGPIDPQFESENGDRVPGMGYIAKYNSLVNKINLVPDDKIHTVRAEMSFLIRKFDPAKLFNIEQAIRHSQELVEKWLPKYKFKKWKVTRNSGMKVTLKYKIERARKIAEILGNAEHWHSHGRGISMETLVSDDIGLMVNDFGSIPELNDHITHYHAG